MYTMPLNCAIKTSRGIAIATPMNAGVIHADIYALYALAYLTLSLILLYIQRISCNTLDLFSVNACTRINTIRYQIYRFRTV